MKQAYKDMLLTLTARDKEGCFVRRLKDAMDMADSTELTALKTAFPDHVAVFEAYQKGVYELGRIVGTEEPEFKEFLQNWDTER